MTFYQITEAIRDTARGLGRIQGMTMGDLSEIDLRRTSLFPLLHMTVNPVERSERINTWSFTITICDKVDFSKEALEDQADPWLGTDNRQDVISDCMLSAERIIDIMTRGDLVDTGIKANAVSSIIPFTDRMNNMLAGVEFTMTINAPNSSVSNGIC